MKSFWVPSYQDDRAARGNKVSEHRNSFSCPYLQTKLLCCCTNGTKVLCCLSVHPHWLCHTCGTWGTSNIHAMCYFIPSFQCSISGVCCTLICQNGNQIPLAWYNLIYKVVSTLKTFACVVHKSNKPSHTLLTADSAHPVMRANTPPSAFLVHLYHIFFS